MNFIIPRYRIEAVMDAWKELCKKAKRLKVAEPKIPTFKDVKEKGKLTGKVKVEISPERIRLAGGWKLIAKLDFSGGDRPVVSVVPGQSFRFTRRKDKDGCDHCHHNRRRHTCYIVENTKGTRKQIGSTCVKDFLGTDPRNMVKYSELVFKMLDDFEENWGGGIPRHESLVDYLTFVAASIRLQGWRSRARFDYSTADQAYDWLCDVKDELKWRSAVKPILNDSAKLANQAIAFAKKLKVPKGEEGQFLENLKNIAINGAFVFNQKGFAAYMVQHYLTNHDETPDNGHFGTVGKRAKDVAVTVEDVRGFSGMYGDGRIVKFRTVADNKLLVWFSTTVSDIVPGQNYQLTGTVKSHDEFRGKSQTAVTRCRLSAAA